MKKILILLGDPASINSEIIFKTWKKLNKNLKNRIYIISSFNVFKAQMKKLNYKFDLIKMDNTKKNINSDKFKIINLDLPFKDPFKFNRIKLERHINECFDLAHKIALNKKKISGIINCPVDKKTLNYKGFGITELLASKCQVNKNSEIMLIRNNELAVSPITTHNNLKDVSRILNKKMIITKIKSINYNYQKIFLKKPKIAILGLNPHNAELRKNSEEKKFIIPAIKHLKKKNIKVYGPFVSDTIFIDDYKKFDVIVGMYHDQVLAPFKALYKFDAINLTLGLKYLRLSPDHGVAKNLIGKNKADPTSLKECIKFLNRFG